MPPGLLNQVFEARFQLRAAVVAGALLLAGFALSLTPLGDDARIAFWFSLAIGLVYGLQAAYLSLRSATFDIDVLMAVAAILATYVGHPEEGAMLLFLFILAGALEDLAMERTRREVQALHALVPEQAVALRDDAWVSVNPESLVAGDTIRIRPRERTPVDCRIVQGQSAFDQSAITGESTPREVKAGDELFAGTINNDDPVDALVLRPSSESSVQRILRLVTQAQSQRAPLQQLIDRLGQPYSIAVTALSFLVVLFWWQVLNAPLVGSEQSQGALYVGITVLIVASPCALVIATPTATLAAISRAARGGVLFKGGQSVQRLADISALCLDKTGTLTFGRPRLYQVHPVAWSNGNELLGIAAGLEQDSTHPIAAAIREAAAARNVEPLKLADIDHVTARGVEGRWQDRPVRLGRYSFVEPLIPICFRNRVKEVLEKIQDRGHVAVTVAAQGPSEDEGQAAVLIMADSVRPGAHELVERLHALGIRPIRMLTGDNALTARKVATALNLDSFDADLLPEQKLQIMNAMRIGPPAIKVGIIGDGVNDAPALAAADASIAIGGIGAAAALESADSVLMTDDLSAVPWVIALARRTRGIITFNLVFALGIIVLMVTLTLAGAAAGRPVPLSIGVLAHEGGTILVVLNSLRLLRVPGFVAGTSKNRTQAEHPAHAGASRG